MSNERRHLRFLITSALLVGPAVGCGSADTEATTTPIEQQPTGNPMGPEPELELAQEEAEAIVADEPLEPRPQVNTRQEQSPVRPRTEPESERELLEDPTGNPVGPDPEAIPVPPPEDMPTINTPAMPQ